MSDVKINRYPAPFVEPGESGLLAGYTLGESELSTFGRYINHAVLGGAAYDLTTRVGTPLVGHGGGVLGAAGSAWRGAMVVPVGNVNMSYRALVQYDAVGPAWTMATRNGGHYVVITPGGGDRPVCALDGGGVISGPGYPIVGRGPVVFDALYDGANQHAVCNGRLEDSDAVVPNIGAAGTLDTGYVGTTRLFSIYNIRRTVAQARASYVRDFARTTIHHWRPAIVGEGPAGGIPTGAVGEGDWSCPLGGATLLFVWRPDLSIAGGGRLALTETGAVGLNMRRLAFMHPRMPAFSSWLYSYEVRTPATDNPIFAITSLRDVDPTAAAAGSYRVQAITTGAVWRNTLHRDNGAALITVDHPLPVAGDVCAILHTRHPSGDHRLYACLNGRWYGDSTVIANDVTYLSSNYIHVAPRGGYVLAITRYQGEIEPAELARVIP